MHDLLQAIPNMSLTELKAVLAAVRAAIASVKAEVDELHLASDDEPEGVVFWYEASLTTRAQNVLSHHDETKFASPKAIAEMGERQLMRFPGFGRTSLEVVREALREQFGRKLHP